MWKFLFLACRPVRSFAALLLLALGLGATDTAAQSDSDRPAPAPPPQIAAARDYRAEWARLKPLAERGDAAAQSDLGALYHKGLGVPQNATEAARLYALAASQGNTKGQANLAALYYFGDGIPRNYAQAARLAQLAADKGDALGQVILGACYWGGAGGLARDEAEAARLYKLSADQNNGLGQLLLAGMYENGRGVEKDPAEAFRLYGLSASQGTAQARTALVRLSINRPDSASSPPLKGPLEIPLHRQNGVLMVPVVIGGVVNTTFVVDSGASDVTIPESLQQRLKRAGLLSDGDFTGTETHQQADGSTFIAKTFVIRSLQVGGKVLENVQASLAPGPGIPLLGQSFLRRFASWSIDNGRQVLVLK